MIASQTLTRIPVLLPVWGAMRKMTSDPAIGVRGMRKAIQRGEWSGEIKTWVLGSPSVDVRNTRITALLVMLDAIEQEGS